METFQLADRHIIESCGLSSYPNTANDESKMEVVKAFNNELVSLYDIKPPISKAKMTAITKAAMKSVKFYKHVVHGVEKFISKCRPDYKIPGLYVIDSIVRQSRHQFGVEKDVFAPRFSKNLLQTFKNICLCPEDDKQKLVRVINLWQKHKVFPEELLKKFLVMVEASEDELPELYRDEIEAVQSSSKKSPTSGKKKKKSPAKSGLENVTTPRSLGNYNDSNKNSVDPGLIQQLQTLTTLLQHNVPNASPVPSAASANDQVKFDKKLLEYDYGEEEEETGGGSAGTQAAPTDSITSIFSNPDILRHLQSIQVQLSMAQAKQQQDQQSNVMMDQQRMLQNQQMQAFSQAMMQQQYQQECNANFLNSSLQGSTSYGGMLTTVDDDLDDKPEIVMEKPGTEPLEVIDLDHIATPPSEKSHRQSYSRSRSRSSSVSRSRSRRNRSRRSRSRSWNRDRSRDREKNEDRRRRALPPIKRKHLAVCSTTLWVGHLSKLVQEQDLSDTFGQFGDIVSIDLIPPRGCAFLCMNRRQDADRALHKLKNTKIHGKAITIAWAPGKGMKGREWKDYWEVDYGVSYIPWSKLTKDTDYDLLEEGGMLDQETMPEWLKGERSLPYEDESVHLEEKRRIPYSGGKSSRALYTPSGTDMDESSNEGDDVQSQQNTDMVIEPSNGVPEQMIPLPDGPQPTTDLPPSLGIPLPPGQSAVPPPNLLNPFGLPPRLLGPMGVLGGNFMPPLGVPPPVPGLLMSGQHMVNRLPPPFPGPPGMPMLNPGPGPNTSLSQIPLPDSSSNLGAVTSTPSTDFKPPPFGLTPPMLFPGNPNIKIDLSRNPMSMGPGNLDSLNNDGPNLDDKNSAFPTFANLMPPFSKNVNSTDQNYRNEDTDYRILGDISNAGSLNESNASETANVASNDNVDKNRTQSNDDSGYNRDSRHSNEFDRDRNYRFPDRNRSFDKDRDRYHERNHRFGGGRSPPPFREDNFDNDRYKPDRDNFRRGRFERDFDRDYKRGRDVRGGRSRDQGPPPSTGPRIRGRSRDRDRDRYRDNRREFGGDGENKRRFEKRDRSRERSSEDSHRNGKRSRWSDKTNDEKWTERAADDDNKWTNKPSDDKSNDEKWADKAHGEKLWANKSNEEKSTVHEKWTDESKNPESTDDQQWADKPIEEKADDKVENEKQEDKSSDEKMADQSIEEHWMDISMDDSASEKPLDNSWSGQSTEEAVHLPDQASNGENLETIYDIMDLERPIIETDQPIIETVQNEVTDTEHKEERTTIDSSERNESEQEPPPAVVETVAAQQKIDPNKFDMFDDSDDLPPPVVSKPAELNEESAGESGSSFPCTTPPPPRIRDQPRPSFQNRMSLMMGRSSPMMGHFGPNSQSGPFQGKPNFLRARFQGHRPHPPFFQGSPRHFSPFGDSRPPRPFMPSRSNNF